MDKRFLINIMVYTSLAVLLFSLKNQLENSRNQNQLLSVQLATLNDSVKVIEQQNGLLTYQIASVNVEKNNLKTALDAADIDNRILKQREINYRKLNNILRARLEAAGKIQTFVRDTVRITETDSIRFLKIEDATNGNLSIFNAKLENKILDFSYHYTVDLLLAQHTENKKTIVSVSLNDPHAKITSANSITVVQKRKFFQKPWFWAVTGLTAGMLIAK